jgi:hypothetical protein
MDEIYCFFCGEPAEQELQGYAICDMCLWSWHNDQGARKLIEDFIQAINDLPEGSDG